MIISNWLKHYFERGGKSEAHKKYLSDIRSTKLQVVFWQIVILVAILGGWEVASRTGMIDPFLFSMPSKIWVLFVDMMFNGNLGFHISVTVAETVVGFVFGTLMGTVLAVIIWWSPFLAKVLDPYIVVLNGMPKVALGPLFIVALGAGYASVIAMALATSFVVSTIVIHSSFKEIDENYIKLAQSFGATKMQVFQKIILPASFPTIISTLKVNVGLAWVGVMFGEFLVSKSGLGYLMIYGFQVFNLSLVMLSMVIIGICATAMYQGVAMLEKRLTRHR